MILYLSLVLFGITGRRPQNMQIPFSIVPPDSLLSYIILWWFFFIDLEGYIYFSLLIYHTSLDQSYLFIFLSYHGQILCLFINTYTVVIFTAVNFCTKSPIFFSSEHSHKLPTNCYRSLSLSLSYSDSENKYNKQTGGLIVGIAVYTTWNYLYCIVVPTLPGGFFLPKRRCQEQN